MIRQINTDELDLIDPLMVKFGQEVDSAVPPNFTERMTSAVKDGKAIVYGAFDNSKLKGFGAFGKVSNRISFVYAQGDSNLEKQLVDTVFINHSHDSTYIGVAGPWVTETISNHLVELGFRKLDRAYMTLDRKTIEAMERPVLNSGMEFEIYDNSKIDELTPLVFKANEDHVDQVVFMNFFGTVEKCKELIENIEKSVYGEYKEGYSWLLRENGKLIGGILLTIRNKGDTGYIPDIVVDPDYQGKGLGKAMMIYSMKALLSGEPDIVKMDLDVTLENDARFLYESLGFETIREYSMYTWLNKSKS